MSKWKEDNETDIIQELDWDENNPQNIQNWKDYKPCVWISTRKRLDWTTYTKFYKYIRKKEK